MANILPKDEELFKRIERERIQIDPLFWDIIYQYIADPLIVIRFIVRFCLDNGKPIPQAEAERIFISIKSMVEIIKRIHQPESIVSDERDPLFRMLKEKGLRLDVVTDELFTQYIRNDLNIIGMAVGMHIDHSQEDRSVPLEDSRIILEHVCSTISFLDRLRTATSKKKVY